MKTGMTMAEKTLASASGLERVVPGQYVTAKVDRLMITECFPLVYQYLEELGIDKLADPGSVTIAFDHEAPASTIQAATWQARSRELAEKLGISSLFDVGKGIGHQLVVENGLCRPAGCRSPRTLTPLLMGRWAARAAGLASAKAPGS